MADPAARGHLGRAEQPRRLRRDIFGLGVAQVLVSGVALVAAGLLIILLTGDTGLLTGWWQSAGDWWNTAASPDAGGVISLVRTLPGDGTSAEAYLGLVVGALVLAVGASVFLLHALSTPDSAPGTVPAGRLQLR